MSVRAGWQQVALLKTVGAWGTTEQNRRESEAKSFPLILCEMNTTGGRVLGVAQTLWMMGMKNFLIFLFELSFVTAVQSLKSCLFETPWLQSARLLCPLSPGVCSNSCPLSQQCYLTISHLLPPPSPFCLQPFPASRSFPMRWFFKLNGQSIWSSATVLPMNILGWFPLRLTGLISLHSKGLSKSSLEPQFESINSSVHWEVNSLPLGHLGNPSYPLLQSKSFQNVVTSNNTPFICSKFCTLDWDQLGSVSPGLRQGDLEAAVNWHLSW